MLLVLGYRYSRYFCVERGGSCAGLRIRTDGCAEPPLSRTLTRALTRPQVGNVHKLLDSLNYIGGFTGFHEFAEFTAEDVGTLDSGASSTCSLLE